MKLACLALGCLFLLGCHSIFLRPDDALEPNDQFSDATRLTPGIAVEGRANQGDIDIFAVDLERAGSLTFEMESRGLENCPAFSVVAPDHTTHLYRDEHRHCHSNRNSTLDANGLGLEATPERYRLRVRADVPGTYHLIIEELGNADNEFPYSWDYRLAVSHDGASD